MVNYKCWKMVNGRKCRRKANHIGSCDGTVSKRELPKLPGEENPKKEWHILTDGGWVRGISETRPYGKLVHIVSDDCRTKPCGGVHGHKL